MSIVSDAVAWLRQEGVPLADPFSPAELDEIEQRFGFRFGPDHRELLLTAVPADGHWTDWRGEESELRDSLDWPLRGMLFDVEHDSFWPPSWGARPVGLAQALDVATQQFRSWPKLVPISGHRYMPASPSEPGAPVFSIYQTDVIYYGGDLLNYVRCEFGRDQVRHRGSDYLPPWSLLAMSEDVP